MKSLLFFYIAIHVSILLPAQRADSIPSRPSTDNLTKSKKQKTAAWVLLGGGTLLTAIGVGIGMSDVNEIIAGEDLHTNSAGPILSVIGLTAMAGSIPLFIAAGKNKKKAVASLSFKMENATQLSRVAFVKSQYPAVAFQIRL